jgi:hypothetical protein
MKYVGLILAIIVALLAGYVFGNIVPFEGFSDAEKGISGDTNLTVKLVSEDEKPLSNIEVDVGEKSGPPTEGGSVVTNEQGIAVFALKPGNYVIFFNMTNFPKNLDFPQGMPETPVLVSSGTINEITLILKAK